MVFVDWLVIRGFVGTQFDNEGERVWKRGEKLVLWKRFCVEGYGGFVSYSDWRSTGRGILFVWRSGGAVFPQY